MRVKLCLCLGIISFIGAVTASLDQEFDPAEDPKFTASPCPTLELECIREYFSQHSQCEKATGPAADPLSISKYSVEIPHCNVSVDVHNAKFAGLSQLKIVEFYFNSETQKLVIAAETPSVKIDTPEAIFKYHKRAREPIERTGSIICDYGPLTFTAIFPSYETIRLKDAEVYTYIGNSEPQYTLGRRIQETDPETKAQYNKMLSNIAVTLQELFSSQGTILMTHYLQQNICDFGLELDTE